MPIFTPGRRWQPAYSPFKQEPLSHRLMEDLEYIISLVKRWRLPLSQELVPCCDFCNRTLSNRAALMTMPARKAWIKASIWRKRLVHRRREKLFNVEAIRTVGAQAACQGSG